MSKIDFVSDINKGYEEAMAYPSVDRFIIKVHWWTFGAFAILTFLNSVVKLASLYASPFAYRIITPTEAIVSLTIGFLAALLPTLLVGKFKNHYHWRLFVTTTLTIFSYLFVFISGGSIEMHFIFFVMIALIVIYNDWRLGWLMLVLTALHHGILNYVAPNWVYYYGRNDFAIVAHGLPVLVAVIFTSILCENNRKCVIELDKERNSLQGRVEQRVGEFRLINASLEEKIKGKTAELDALKKELDKEAEERTKELKDSVVELEDANKYIAEGRTRMAKIQSEIESLKKELLNKG